MPHPRLYLIDGSSYVYRAFFALGHLSNSKGLPTQAVFGFTQMVRKLLDQQKPKFMAVVFDTKGPTFRHERYREYKAHRPPVPEGLIAQLPYIKAVSQSYGLAVLEKTGFEADDIIATLTEEGEAGGFEIVIISGDKDLMQLISARTSMWDTMKDQVFDLESVKARFGTPPSKLIDIMGLAGDSSDNVPGVPGIGEKTASKLIQTYGSLEKLLEQLESVSPAKLKEKLSRYKEQALLSRELVTLDKQVPLDLTVNELKVRPENEARLKELFQELEFKKFLDELGGIQTVETMELDFRMVTDREELAAILTRIRKCGRVSLDLETTSPDPMRAEIVGVALSYEEGSAVYVPVGHTYIGAPEQLPLAEVLHSLETVLEDPGIRKIGQNIKYEWVILRRCGFAYRGLAFDTMIASYLLNPSRRTHNLNQIALDFLSRKLISFKEVVGTGSKAKNFSEVEVEQAVIYAAEDAEAALACANRLEAILKTEGLEDLFYRMEMPLIPVLAEMEMQGVRIDSQALALFSRELELKLSGLEERIYLLAGEPFNINSPQQLSRLLFEKLQLPAAKKTKGKSHSSTDAEVLRELAVHYPIAAEIWNFRSLSKLKSTYVDALPKLVHPQTGRLHTSFNQTITATGRLSSSEPNLQNIPVRTEEGRRLRQAFVPEPGWMMLSADYSQIELRILAHYSQDASLMEAFQTGQDIHCRTAADIFHVAPEEVPSEMRNQAKVINFGIIYGMSAFGLSKELGIAVREAQTLIDHYFLQYQGVKKYIDQTLEEARRTRIVTTLFNRRRHMEEINSSNRVVRQFAERTAVNTPIQGTAADLIKMAMIRIHETLAEEKMRSRMILQVHDELVFEAPEKEVKTLKRLVKDHMESAVELRVPLMVHLSTGRNWAELK